MILLLECIIFSILFSIMIFIPLYKNPIGQIMSYPTEIRKSVESLPQYKDSIEKREKKHLLIFRNVKKFRIPGTEDMDKEYKSAKHHVKGAFIGIILGIIVAILSAIYVQIFNVIF